MMTSFLPHYFAHGHIAADIVHAGEQRRATAHFDPVDPQIGQPSSVPGREGRRDAFLSGIVVCVQLDQERHPFGQVPPDGLFVSSLS